MAKARQILICAVQFDQEIRSGAMSLLDLAPIAAKHGARGVEYRDIYWKDKARELPALRSQLDRSGLMATYATFTPLYHVDPAKQAKLLQDVDDANALGAPLLRVFRGEPPVAGPAGDDARRAAQRVIARAGDLGLRLALENHIGEFGWRLSDVRDALLSLDSPVMGTNVDIANYAVTGEDALAAIKTLAPWVIYAHLKDARSTPEGLKQTYLGNGSLPLAELVAAIEAVGQPVPLCFEFGGGGDPEGAIAKSMVLMQTLA
ncbi:MAG: sugar phosphate isomerase/epimerase family protein [Chloroflexota bacterium]